MENGFSIKLYGDEYKNCFIHNSYYVNGDLKLSLFGKKELNEETEHFADITLEQNKKHLMDDEIVVDYRFKPELIPQLIELGILLEQTGICVVNGDIYPIYKIDVLELIERQFQMQELVAV